MIRLLVIVFALVAALGGGAAGLVHFAIIPDFSGGIISELVGVKGQAPTGPAEPVPPPRVDPVFVQMAPMLVPVIRDGELKENVYIALRLEFNPDNPRLDSAAMQRLHDVFLRAMFDMVPEQYETRSTLDLEKIRTRLLVISERVVGPDVIQDIVFLSVFNR